MRSTGEKGLTLVELLVSITIMVIIAAAAMPLLSASLNAHSEGIARAELYQEGLMLMERMTSGVRKTTILQIPNNHTPTRNMLVFSKLVNDDNDFYFGDPLFPRVDEDTGESFTWWGNGTPGVDDNGDGTIDNGATWKDNDEDGLNNEDDIDGIDNDGDGNIDEDPTADWDDNAVSGIEGIDDDGDGQVDEEGSPDEDEDGSNNEEQIQFLLYTFDSATNTLREIEPNNFSGLSPPVYSKIMSTHVTGFTTTYYPSDATKDPMISIALTLTGDDGKSIQFFEYVYPENILQKDGKRVR
jgi:prepilin-type N-terminal cleavage/methylation domain-containing protein